MARNIIHSSNLTKITNLAYAVEKERTNPTLPDFNSPIYNIPRELREMAADYWEKGRDENILSLMSNEVALIFVGNNIHRLIARGTYEQCLIDAYSGIRTNFSNWNTNYIEHLFLVADRDKLLKAGDPLPGGEEFKLYRGVAGNKNQRRIRGISWTSDPNCAAWFAQRYVDCGIGDPAVYEVEIFKGDIYAYINGRNEHEFLIVPEPKMKIRKLKILPDHRKFAELIQKSFL
jgi:hypothetical protein